MRFPQFALGLALVVVVAVAYEPATSGWFIWDDDFYVSSNPVLRSAAGLRRLWFEPTSTPQYYPLVFTSFWVEYQLFGPKPAVYHWTNVLLHGLSAVLFWRVLERLRVPGAWVAAALFALHPVCVESVAWITERKNVLSGVFFWAALLSYLRFSPPTESTSAGRGSWKWYPAALGFFLCALLSKTITCSLPAVLVLLLWWQRGTVSRRDWLSLAPLFALGLALGLTTVWLEKYHVRAEGEDWKLTGVERILVAGRALWFYAGKLAWPSDLTFIYPRWTIDPSAWWQYLFPLAAVTVMAVLWLRRSRLGRGPLVAGLCFAGVLAPALGFFDVYPFRFSFVADHFQYLASTALLPVAEVLGAKVAERCGLGKVGPALLAAAVLLALGVLTWRQAHVYRNLQALWTDTLRKNPGCWMAHNNLGSVLFGLGRFDEAETHFRMALKARPTYAEARCGLGAILALRGQRAEAKEQYEQARQDEPDSLAPYIKLAEVAMRESKYEEARALLKEGLRRNATPSPKIKALEQTLDAIVNRSRVQAEIKQLQQQVDALVQETGELRTSLNTAATTDTERRSQQRLQQQQERIASLETAIRKLREEEQEQQQLLQSLLAGIPERVGAP